MAQRQKRGATISGGQVTNVTLIDSSGDYTLGSGYNFAEVKFSGGGSPTTTAIKHVQFLEVMVDLVQTQEMTYVLPQLW